MPAFSPEEREILARYQWRCAVCRLNAAVTLHEHPPRSLNPNWRAQPETRFPVCAACHERLHHLPMKERDRLLKKDGD